MKPITWEYLAGFFDGEGCIHYLKRSYGRYVTMHVSQGYKNEEASNICRDILEFLRSSNINARLVHYGQRKVSGPTSRVIASSAGDCTRWLNGMLPFLRVKKKQAEEAIEFMESIKTRKRKQSTEHTYYERKSI